MPLSGSETVHGAVAPLLAPDEHLGRHHRCMHVPMPEQFLDRASVIAIVEEMRTEQMPESRPHTDGWVISQFSVVRRHFPIKCTVLP
jgi:hypothetical protein